MTKHLDKLKTQINVIDKSIDVKTKIKNHYSDIIELEKDLAALSKMYSLLDRIESGYQDYVIVDEICAINDEFNFEVVKCD